MTPFWSSDSLFPDLPFSSCVCKVYNESLLLYSVSFTVVLLTWLTLNGTVTGLKLILLNRTFQMGSWYRFPDFARCGDPTATGKWDASIPAIRCLQKEVLSYQVAVITEHFSWNKECKECELLLGAIKKFEKENNEFGVVSTHFSLRSRQRTGKFLRQLWKKSLFLVVAVSDISENQTQRLMSWAGGLQYPVNSKSLIQ